MSQGDILIEIDENSIMNADQDTAIVPITKVNYWPTQFIPLQFAIDTRGLLARFNQATAAISSNTDFTFVERTDETDYIKVINDTSMSSDLCQSFLGRQGGEQHLLIGSDCTAGNIIHELLHAMGFVHEQNRFDRDQSIRIHWDNIKKEFRHNFQMLPSAVSDPFSTAFDFESIMLYGSLGFSSSGLPAMTKLDGKIFNGNRDHLSQMDITRLNLLAKKTP